MSSIAAWMFVRVMFNVPWLWITSVRKNPFFGGNQNSYAIFGQEDSFATYDILNSVQAIN